MRRITAFALLAMVPAALNVSPAAARGVLMAPICSGDGIARQVSLPIGPQDVPGKQVPGCCVKGCHSGERKRGARKCC